MGKTRLQLSWYNKDKAIIPTEKGKYGYTWVEPSDPRYCETHTLVYDEYISGIDPFTVFGVFNKGLSEKSRVAIVSEIGKLFNINANAPSEFLGIPVLNNLNATYEKGFKSC